ncbi:MAG TPA: TIGR02281 family clan AA aspartic protease [Phenylobacterium sp.]|jgi:aspartyl protease family protein
MSNPGPWSQLEPEAPPPRRRASPLRVLLWLAVIGAMAGGVFLLAQRFPGQDRQDWSRVGYLVLLLAAVSARILTSGPVNWSQKARHAAIWAGVALVIAVGFAYRGELIDAGQRVRGELIPSLAQTGGAGAGGAQALVVTASEAGYQVMGEVNGQPVRFVIDTGATETVLSPDDAHRAGLDSPSLDFSHLAETANGTGRGARAVAATLGVGSIQFSNMPVVINQAPMSGSLLGMSFLRRLDGFEVRGGRLYLHPKG